MATKKMTITWIAILLLITTNLLYLSEMTSLESLVLPTLVVFLAGIQIIDWRADSYRETVFLLFVKLYMLGVNWIIHRNNGVYWTDINTSIQDDIVTTTISYSGIQVILTSEKEALVEEYLSVTDSDGQIDIYRDELQFSFIGTKDIYNCSTCTQSDTFGAPIKVTLSNTPIDISWTMTLCENCFTEVMKSQLRTLEEETNFKSQILVEQL